MLKTEQIVNNTYRIVRHIDTGGMSYIYEVVGPTNTPMVLKVAKQPTTLMNNQIDNEAKILATVHHKRIPILYDKVKLNEHYHGIIIQQLDGVHLIDIIETEKIIFKWDEVLDIAKQLADIIKTFHNRQNPVMIRDIKPSNILLANHNQIYLLDFGTSVVRNSTGQIRALGTIGYAAPEQFENGVFDLRSDLFSFGATLFYLISGGENIYTSNYKSIMSERLPNSFTSLIMKLTETDVTKRFDSINQVINMLRKVKPSIFERIFRREWK